MFTWLESWKKRASELNMEVFALYLAYKDPRVPWYARIFVACVAAYALSPIDLIPDFIPVLGYLDDILIIPLGIVIAIKLIPPQVMHENRLKAQQTFARSQPTSKTADRIILMIWIILAALLVWVLFNAFYK